MAWRPSRQNLAGMSCLFYNRIIIPCRKCCACDIFAVFPVMDHIGGMDHGKPAVKGVEQGCPKGMHFASPMALRHVQMMEKSPWCENVIQFLAKYIPG